MTDYTPTTEDIRQAWKNTLVPKGENIFEFVDPDVAETEFNRWLIVERKRVAEMATSKERDRIIALLESTKDMTTIESGQLINYADHAIALIKGETEPVGNSEQLGETDAV